MSLSSDSSRPDQRRFVLDDLRRTAMQKIAAATHEAERLAATIGYAALVAELDLEGRESSGLSQQSDQWKEAAKQIVVLQRDAAKYAADWALIDAKLKQVAADSSLQKANESKNAAAISKAKKAKTVADKAVKAATDRLQKSTDELATELTTKFKRREQKVYPTESTGRRLAFAKWLTDRKNPLTARVAMNHIWLRHFGRAVRPHCERLWRRRTPANTSSPAGLAGRRTDAPQLEYETDASNDRQQRDLSNGIHRRRSEPCHRSRQRIPVAK